VTPASAPLDPSLRHPLDLVLHIGSGKTGTSSVQNFLHRNRDRLAELGHLYPRSPGRERHTQLGHFVMPDKQLVTINTWRSQELADPEEFRQDFRRRLVAEVNGSGLSHVLMSDEALYGAPTGALTRMRAFTDQVARTVRLVVYLRRQDDHLISRYQQVVKVGEVRRLAERTASMDLSWTYDYHARLSGWRRLLEPTELVVRRFEPDRFVDGSLYQDFLDAAGVDVRAEDLEQPPNRNESLDADSVEFLRLLNLYRVEHEGARPGHINNRPLVVRLAEASSRPVLTLPPAVLDEFMSLWEESNRAVARDFLGDPRGELFRTPRKTSDTTSHQVLDPGRVDHFLELLELPGHLHAPLRALAEREAAVG
jgi:hypothetical protein